MYACMHICIVACIHTYIHPSQDAVDIELSIPNTPGLIIAKMAREAGGRLLVAVVSGFHGIYWGYPGDIGETIGKS